jgi:U4/U6 small nuclear ribonucleoprotein PRP4
MAEYHDLNEDSREEQLRHAEVLRKFEAHKRARSINVPTAIPEIKLRLRELGQPITIFGEDHADRRERLREVIARLELDQEQLDKLQAIINQNPTQVGQSSSTTGASGPVVTTQDKVQKEAVFYSPATDAMISARKDIATFSFAKSQQRLTLTKRIRESEVLEEEENKTVHDMYTNTKDLTLNSSQVGDDRPITTVRYSADGNFICSGSLSGVVKIWDASSLANKAVLRGTLDRITAVSWHPESRFDNGGPMLVAASSAEGCCHIYDFRKFSDQDQSATEETAQPSESMDLEDGGDGSDGGSGDDDEMDEGSDSELVRAARIASTANAGGGSRASQQSVVHKLQGHRGMVMSCDFHPMGRYLGTAGHDGTWRLWDIEQGQELLLQDGHAKDLSGIAFHPDGSLAMTGDAGGVALLWDIRSGQMIQAFQGHIKKISSVSFSANGFHAVTSSLDNTVKIWDLRRRKCCYTLPAHTNIVAEARYSPSGEQLLTCSFDNTMKVWSARDFHILRTLAGHSGKVMSGDFAPDEKHIISAGFDRTIKLWAHKDEF